MGKTLKKSLLDLDYRLALEQLSMHFTVDMSLSSLNNLCRNCGNLKEDEKLIGILTIYIKGKGRIKKENIKKKEVDCIVNDFSLGYQGFKIREMKGIKKVTWNWRSLNF